MSEFSGPHGEQRTPSGGASTPPPTHLPAHDATTPRSLTTPPSTSIPATPAGYSFTSQPTHPYSTAGTTGVPRAAGTTAGPLGASPAGIYASQSTHFGSPSPANTYPGGGASGLTPPPCSTPTQQPSSSRRGPGWGGVIVVAAVAALVASAGTAGLVRMTDSSDTRPTNVPTTLATGATTQTVSSSVAAPDWEAVTNAVANSVVSITVKTSSGIGVGSGVIYDAQGDIVTNHHVVAGATQIQVTLADGRIYAASLAGSDPATDLAVVTLEHAPSDLTVAQFGDSSVVVPGQDVMAIGNPLGLSSTVTTGIVSAVNRPVVTSQNDPKKDSGSESGLPEGLEELLRPHLEQQSSGTSTYTNALQIDAAINPGNSGGPLFDETGHVIGITSSIAQVKEDSGSIGLGFAIPGNLVVKVADQLIDKGQATHAYLGVSIGDGDATVDGVMRAGAEVGSVEKGSPAAKADVRQGDVITAINGKSVSQAAALTGFVRQYSAGDTVTLTVVRGEKELSIDVTLAERSDS